MATTFEVLAEPTRRHILDLDATSRLGEMDPRIYRPEPLGLDLEHAAGQVHP